MLCMQEMIKIVDCATLKIVHPSDGQKPTEKRLSAHSKKTSAQIGSSTSSLSERARLRFFEEVMDYGTLLLRNYCWAIAKTYCEAIAKPKG